MIMMATEVYREGALNLLTQLSRNDITIIHQYFVVTLYLFCGHKN